MNGPPPPTGTDCKVTVEPTQVVLLGLTVLVADKGAPAVIATVPVAVHPKLELTVAV